MFAVTKSDPWFLVQIEDLIKEEQRLQGSQLSDLDKQASISLKRKGFADRRLADVLGCAKPMCANCVISMDCTQSISASIPVPPSSAPKPPICTRPMKRNVRRAPATRTRSWFWVADPTELVRVLSLITAVYMQHWQCAKMATRPLWSTVTRRLYPQITTPQIDCSLNQSPWKMCWKLCAVEKPKGVIVQFGGQTHLKLARALEAHGVPIVGTTPDAIDRAEDRERFQQMIEKLDLLQPSNSTARSTEDAVVLARQIGYPLVVRPSYVLGGRAMEIVYKEDELRHYMQTAVEVSEDSPVLLDFFPAQCH